LDEWLFFIHRITYSGWPLEFFIMLSLCEYCHHRKLDSLSAKSHFCTKCWRYWQKNGACSWCLESVRGDAAIEETEDKEGVLHVWHGSCLIEATAYAESGHEINSKGSFMKQDYDSTFEA
jgi:hypothetical protein